MKYNYHDIKIPTDKREACNKKITALLHSGNMQGVTAEEVFNVYTGKGGLHGLSRSSYDN